MPGIINENWTLIEKPGIYRGQCAELCGKDHGFMPIVVQALPKDEFAAWLARKQAESRPVAVPEPAAPAASEAPSAAGQTVDATAVQAPPAA